MKVLDNGFLRETEIANYNELKKGGLDILTVERIKGD